MKRCFSLILAVILFGTMLPQGVLKVNAADFFFSSVEFKYSTESSRTGIS